MEAFVLFTTMTVVGLLCLVGILWRDHRHKKHRRDKTS